MHHILLTYTSPIIIPHYVILPCENTSNRISSHIFFWYFLRDDFPQDLILKKQLALPGTIKALPGGSRITGLGPPGAEGPVQEMWKKNRSAGKIYHEMKMSPTYSFQHAIMFCSKYPTIIYCNLSRFWIVQFGLCSRSCWQHVTTRQGGSKLHRFAKGPAADDGVSMRGGH